MAQRETIKSLSQKIEMMQIQFDICDKHRQLAEEVVAEQRLRIKALERENEELRANVMILESAASNRHNPQDMETIMRLIGEKAELERRLNALQNEAHHKKDAYAYLDSVSAEAKKFVQDLVSRGEANLYHSVMSTMSTVPNLTSEEFSNFYLKKLGSQRPYLLENRQLVDEIIDCCWKKFHFKNKEK